MTRHNPDHLTYMVHELANGLSWQLNRVGRGYFDKLDRAIEDGEQIVPTGLEAARLADAIVTLRGLAEGLEERREALTGRAPRLFLVAAE